MTLEEIEDKLKLTQSPLTTMNREDIDWLISRIKTLEEGIRRHQKTDMGNCELYALLPK